MPGYATSDCVVCGKGFRFKINYARPQRQRFCSTTCAGLNRRSDTVFTCKQCGNTFPRELKCLKTFCSRKCKTEYSQGRNCGRSIRATIGELFWNHVEKLPNDGCWIWHGKKHKFGYGMMGRRDSASGKTVEFLAHRISWELHNGSIPDGIEVCHNCPTGDNPSCVRPGHLFLGTQADNMADMAQKGRSRHGEKSIFAKLTEVAVSEIRRSYLDGERVAEIASRHKIGTANVYAILSRKTWTRVA